MRGQRAVAVVLVLAGSLYALAVVVSVSPYSPASYRLKSLSTPALGGTFSQRWTLFSPNPSTFDRNTLVQVRCGDAGRPSDFYDLSHFMNEVARSQGLFSSLATRYLGPAAGLLPDRNGPYYVREELRAKFDLSISLRDIERDAALIAARERERMRRYLTGVLHILPAAARCPPESRRFRYVVLLTDAQPFAARYESGRHARTRSIYESNWNTPAPNVTSWRP